MRKLWFARGFFETKQYAFQAGEIAARHSDAAQRLEECGEQRGRFRNGLFFERVQCAAVQVFRKLIRPERFDNGNKLIQSGGDQTPCGSLGEFQAPQIVQNNGPRFAAGSVRASVHKLPKSLPQSGNRNAPDFRAAQHGRFLARRKLQPEAVNQLFAMLFRGPGHRQRGKMLRSMRTRVGAGLHKHIRQTMESRAYRLGSQRAACKLRAEEFQNDVFRQAQQIRKRLLAVARRILRDVLKQHAHALAAGLFHGPVNRTRGFLGRDAAGGFERRSKAGQQAQRGHQVVEVRRFDR